MSSARKRWTDQDRLQALSLYSRLSFGQLHQRQPEVMALAKRMARSPSSVAMKLCNFASLDPEVLALGKKGLSGASQQDRQLWARFIESPEAVAHETVDAWSCLGDEEPACVPVDSGLGEDFSGHDTDSWQRRRVGQALFRKAVMIRYDTRCVITGLRHEDLLIASHVIPWQSRVESRLDPANGLCLNALHDRAFDKGLLGIDGNDRVRLSPALDVHAAPGQGEHLFDNLEGERLTIPESVFPNRDYLAWHFRECFRG